MGDQQSSSHTGGDRFIGPTGPAADRLKEALDRRWETLRTEDG